MGITSFYHSGFLFDLRRHPGDDPLAYHDSCRRRVDCSILRDLGSPSSTREVLRGGYAYTPRNSSHRSERTPDDRIHCLERVAYCFVRPVLSVLVRIEYPKPLICTLMMVTRGLICFNVFSVPKDCLELGQCDRAKGTRKVIPFLELMTSTFLRLLA